MQLRNLARVFLVTSSLGISATGLLGFVGLALTHGVAEAQSTVAPNSRCTAAVTALVVFFDPEQKRAWSPAQLAQLCRGAESSAEPAQCFHEIMSGRIDWGGGTRWMPDNALRLCAGTRDARARVECFQGAVRNGGHWDQAIQSCAATTAAVSGLTQVDPGTLPTRTAPRQLPSCSSPNDCDGDGHDSIAAGGDDCDDNDTTRYPGNIEVANDRDEDCDSSTLGDGDYDGDGFIDFRACNPEDILRPNGRQRCGDDCGDRTPWINPHAPELPNGIDDNCDGEIDNLVGDWWSPGPSHPDWTRTNPPRPMDWRQR
jgi:hypothetical protein